MDPAYLSVGFITGDALCVYMQSHGSNQEVSEARNRNNSQRFIIFTLGDKKHSKRQKVNIVLQENMEVRFRH